MHRLGFFFFGGGEGGGAKILISICFWVFSKNDFLGIRDVDIFGGTSNFDYFMSYFYNQLLLFVCCDEIYPNTHQNHY